jgi:hypothetical protein
VINVAIQPGARFGLAWPGLAYGLFHDLGKTPRIWLKSTQITKIEYLS